MGRLGIAAYAQYLGAALLELAVVLPERGDLVCSTACEVVEVEGQDDLLLPPKIL